MMQTFADIQPLVLGTILLWAGTWKVFAGRSRELAAQSALSALLRRPQVANIMHKAVGVTEILLGLFILVPPVYLWEIGAVTALSVVFVGYLFIARRIAPDKPCACLGGRAVPISWRTLTRAGLLLASSVLAWGAQTLILSEVLTNPWLIIMFIAELIVFIGLSSDISWPTFLTRTMPAQSTGMNHTVPDCAIANVPWPDTIRQLEASATFQDVAAFLHPKIIDQWRDKCWRYLSYEAEYEGQHGTAIFAVPMLSQQNDIRAVIIDETDGHVLLTIASHDQNKSSLSPARDLVT